MQYQLLPVLQRFISIGDLSVWAICGCNGFAAQCLEDPVTSRYTCQCEGHTCGTDCSSCCPGYGGAEFMSFDSGNGTTCQGEFVFLYSSPQKRTAYRVSCKAVNNRINRDIPHGELYYVPQCLCIEQRSG